MRTLRIFRCAGMEKPMLQFLKPGFMRKEIEEEAGKAGFTLDACLDNGLQILAILKKPST